MGIKTKLTLQTINQFTIHEGIQFTSMAETKDGISDTTYIVTDANNKKYICKLYESCSFKEVEEKQRFLSLLQTDLPVPKPLLKTYNYLGKPLTFYTFIMGNSPTTITQPLWNEIP